MKDFSWRKCYNTILTSKDINFRMAKKTYNKYKQDLGWYIHFTIRYNFCTVISTKLIFLNTKASDFFYHVFPILQQMWHPYILTMSTRPYQSCKHALLFWSHTLNFGTDKPPSPVNCIILEQPCFNEFPPNMKWFYVVWQFII